MILQTLTAFVAWGLLLQSFSEAFPCNCLPTKYKITIADEWTMNKIPTGPEWPAGVEGITYQIGDGDFCPLDDVIPVSFTKIVVSHRQPLPDFYFVGGAESFYDTNFTTGHQLFFEPGYPLDMIPGRLSISYEGRNQAGEEVWAKVVVTFTMECDLHPITTINLGWAIFATETPPDPTLCLADPTEPPTKSPSKAPTRSPTQSPTNAPTKAPTVSPTKAPTAAPTTAPTKGPTVSPTHAPLCNCLPTKYKISIANEWTMNNIPTGPEWPTGVQDISYEIGDHDYVPIGDDIPVTFTKVTMFHRQPLPGSNFVGGVESWAETNFTAGQQLFFEPGFPFDMIPGRITIKYEGKNQAGEEVFALVKVTLTMECDLNPISGINLGWASFETETAADPTLCFEGLALRTTGVPTVSPTQAPTKGPTASPTKAPTTEPTVSPTKAPTNEPTISPTKAPTAGPTNTPTKAPTVSPTAAPTNEPTMSPTNLPTKAPTVSPTNAPTKSPSKSPTKAPTNEPTMSPTNAPTKVPTVSPTVAPTNAPTNAPTVSPTNTPTKSPSKAPTQAPTKAPSETPTKSPTKAPTVSPTKAPTVLPTKAPTRSPTKAPTVSPTGLPTDAPIPFLVVTPAPTDFCIGVGETGCRKRNCEARDACCCEGTCRRRNGARRCVL